ncbi:hypothetical protein TNCV_3310991 [Trichonephila clavipes]|nr:hypothetical protein TNCV_3310991 [Trichonephila clavipes]
MLTLPEKALLVKLYYQNGETVTATIRFYHLKKGKKDFLHSSFVERRLSERLLSGTSNIRTSCFLSTTCTVYGNAWNMLWPDFESKKDINDDNGEENTEFVQLILGFQECDENVETPG